MTTLSACGNLVTTLFGDCQQVVIYIIVHMMLLLLSGIGVEVASVSLVLKESQSDAVELKPWMTISDLYCRLTVKFIHIQSMTDPSTSS